MTCPSHLSVLTYCRILIEPFVDFPVLEENLNLGGELLILCESQSRTFSFFNIFHCYRCMIYIFTQGGVRILSLQSSFLKYCLNAH